MKTSYYANLKKIDLNENMPVAISGDEGKIVGFEGRAMRSLSPYTFFRKWKEKENNIENNFKNGEISPLMYQNLKTINQQEYIQNFYDKVLKKLDPRKVYNELGENAVLLCFEKPTEFCHRFLVAGWLELTLGVQIDEYGYENDKQVQQNKENLKAQLAAVMEKDRIK